MKKYSKNHQKSLKNIFLQLNNKYTLKEEINTKYQLQTNNSGLMACGGGGGGGGGGGN